MNFQIKKKNSSSAVQCAQKKEKKKTKYKYKMAKKQICQHYLNFNVYYNN